MAVFPRSCLLLHSALAMLLLAGCAPRHASPQPDFATLRSGWITDLSAHKLDASIARYAADAVFFSPDGTHVDGRDAIRSLYTSVFANYSSSIQLTPIRTSYTAGDSVAFESGIYAEDLTSLASHAVMHVHGDYLTIYRHAEDNRWLISQQLWTLASAPSLQGPVH